MSNNTERYGIWIALSTLFLGIVTQWVTVANRIAILEVKVEQDRASYGTMTKKITEMDSKLDNIYVGIQHLQDIKQDKDYNIKDYDYPKAN